jgi:hypothetical protein
VCLSVCERERARARVVVRGCMSCVKCAYFKDHCSWAATAAGKFLKECVSSYYSGSVRLLRECRNESQLFRFRFAAVWSKHYLSFAFSLQRPSHPLPYARIRMT